MAKAEQPPSPWEMSEEEIEAELRTLLKHQEWLDNQPVCTLERCSGEPHAGVPYKHDPHYPQAEDPLEAAMQTDDGYRSRPHLEYLAGRLAKAMHDVENGESRFITVSMPPRMGKSALTSVNMPIWLLRQHPDWKIGLVSHSPALAVSWGRQVRRVVEEHGTEFGLQIAHDAGAVADWQTTEGGSIVSRSAPGQSITGLGFKVMLVDDLVKDFAAAHSAVDRESLWDWWVANAQTRLEPPSLVVVIGTRWHEDDFIGRLLSPEYSPDRDKWEVIKFPAIAEQADVLGRSEGDPLFSPLLEETREEALERWAQMKTSMGSYSWAALYQQRPSPAQGAVFDVGWWRYWTHDPAKVTGDGRVVLAPDAAWRAGQWVDSWDLTFKGSENSDFVVGQRWVRTGPDRYLVAQQRGRWSFTETLDHMERWGRTDDHDVSPYGECVHQCLIEDAANGSAAIDVLRKRVSGVKPVKARTSKEIRARAITPEIESGNVYLPYPSDPGNEWVEDLLSELREFPNGKHDDQVDALTQALNGLRDGGRGSVAVPTGRLPGRSVMSGNRIQRRRR